jgi:hypothetical protein
MDRFEEVPEGEAPTEKFYPDPTDGQMLVHFTEAQMEALARGLVTLPEVVRPSARMACTLAIVKYELIQGMRADEYDVTLVPDGRPDQFILDPRSASARRATVPGLLFEPNATGRAVGRRTSFMPPTPFLPWAEMSVDPPWMNRLDREFLRRLTDAWARAVPDRPPGYQVPRGDRERLHSFATALCNGSLPYIEFLEGRRALEAKEFAPGAGYEFVFGPLDERRDGSFGLGRSFWRLS